MTGITERRRAGPAGGAGGGDDGRTLELLGRPECAGTAVGAVPQRIVSAASAARTSAAAWWIGYSSTVGLVVLSMPLEVQAEEYEGPDPEDVARDWREGPRRGCGVIRGGSVPGTRVSLTALAEAVDGREPPGLHRRPRREARRRGQVVTCSGRPGAGPFSRRPQSRAVSSRRSFDLDTFSGGFATAPPGRGGADPGRGPDRRWGCSLNMWTLRHGPWSAPERRSPRSIWS